LAFLRFAGKWEFDARKKAGIDWLRMNGDAVEKIAAGMLFEEVREEFYIPAFRKLTCPEVPLGQVEGKILGPRILVALMHCQFYARERNYTASSGDWYFPDSQFRSILQQHEVLP
jgi:hypothetical protein